MILSFHFTINRFDNLAPRGNCVKRDVGQIFGLGHAIDYLVNSLQDIIFLFIFYSGVCWFEIKIFEQRNKIILELRSIVEDLFVRTRTY